MKFIVVTIGILLGILPFSSKVPKKMKKFVAIMGMLFGFGISLYIAYAIIKSLLTGNIPMAVMLFWVAGLFMGFGFMMLSGFLEAPQRSIWKIFFNLFLLIFFVGFFFMLIDSLFEQGMDMPLWREIGLFLITIIGIAENIFGLVKKFKERDRTK